MKFVDYASGTQIRILKTRQHRPSVWERLAMETDELFAKPDPPEGFEGLTTTWATPSPATYTCIPLSVDYSPIELRILGQMGRREAAPWPRNRLEKRIQRALGSYKFSQAVAKFEEDTSLFSEAVDQESWNADFWEHITRERIRPRNDRNASHQR